MKLKYFITILAITLLWSCSSDEPTSREYNPDRIEYAEEIILTQEQKNIVSSYNLFATKLLENVIENDRTGNIAISPLSVTTALGMVANGAKGETLDEITTLWGLPGSDIESMNELNRLFLSKFPTLDPTATFIPANSIWINSSCDNISPAFKKIVNNIYYSQVNSISFDLLVNKVNAWVKDKTNGKIRNILDMNPGGNIVLVNTLYFKARWYAEFDKSLTKNRTFHNSDGNDIKVKMMDGGDKLYILSKNDKGGMISIPYGNKAFRMDIIIPNEGVDPIEAMSSLSEDRNYSSVKLRMPRFEVSSKYDLADRLYELGLHRTISSNGDFSLMSPGIKGFNTIIHETRVSSEETGVEVASATVVGTYTAAPIPSKPEYELVTVDRPFIFLISEASTNAIIFAGYVRNL